MVDTSISVLEHHATIASYPTSNGVNSMNEQLPNDSGCKVKEAVGKAQDMFSYARGYATQLVSAPIGVAIQHNLSRAAVDI